ncbi:MAG: hypothetical protein KDC88_06095 [Ignavibacteriae bacterium]|nr:hypothetical protein [Ignavibacteriota bacterium]MCB9209497.1 hypothetical protein [Ignavibacteriales bacterium]MCB9258140.1 hypothetical protein [Ignavibacteriales bacterium]
MKNNVLFIILPIFIFAGEIYSQTENSNSILEKNKPQKSIKNSIKTYDEDLLFNIHDFNLLQQNEEVNNPLLDSLKYVYELIILCKMDLETVPGLSIAEELMERKERQDLIMQSLREYYKVQPKVDLGKLGKILGISEKVLALMFGIIMI